MQPISGTYRHGRVELDERPEGWSDGDAVLVLRFPLRQGRTIDWGALDHVIIAGFGLSGRFIADVFRSHGVDFVVIDSNPKTVETQKKLGGRVIGGDVRDERVLRQAGIERAGILALTVPDEKTVLDVVPLARKLNPTIYITARTQHTSTGLQASQLGADEVIEAEYAVALDFYQSFLRKFAKT